MNEQCSERHPVYGTRCIERHYTKEIRHDDGVVDWRTPSCSTSLVQAVEGYMAFIYHHALFSAEAADAYADLAQQLIATLEEAK